MTAAVFDFPAIARGVARLTGHGSTGDRYGEDGAKLCNVSGISASRCNCFDCIAAQRAAAMRNLRSPEERVAYLREEPLADPMPVPNAAARLPDRSLEIPQPIFEWRWRRGWVQSDDRIPPIVTIDGNGR